MALHAKRLKNDGYAQKGTADIQNRTQPAVVVTPSLLHCGQQEERNAITTLCLDEQTHTQIVGVVGLVSSHICHIRDVLRCD